MTETLNEKARRLLEIRRKVGVITTVDVSGYDWERAAEIDLAWMRLVPEICEAVLSSVLAGIARPSFDMTNDARKKLIDARNDLRAAIVSLRGGHSSVMDTCDEALASLDIAIGQALAGIALQREADVDCIAALNAEIVRECGELKSVSWIIRQWREAEARAMQAEEKADELTAHVSLLQEMETYLQHKTDCELARDGLYKDGEPRQKSINHRWNQVTMKNEYDWRQCECTCGLAALLRRSPAPERKAG